MQEEINTKEIMVAGCLRRRFLKISMSKGDASRTTFLKLPFLARNKNQPISSPYKNSTKPLVILSSHLCDGCFRGSTLSQNTNVCVVRPETFFKELLEELMSETSSSQSGGVWVAGLVEESTE